MAIHEIRFSKQGLAIAIGGQHDGEAVELFTIPSGANILSCEAKDDYIALRYETPDDPPPTVTVDVRKPYTPPAYTIDYLNPMLLDTPDKVVWANAIERERCLPVYWRLGDHCPYRPMKSDT